MLTRRTIIKNAVPAVLATTGVCIATAEREQESLESLLEWAQQNNLYLDIRGDGTAAVDAVFNVHGIDRDGSTGGVLNRLSHGRTLRDALEQAKRVMEIWNIATARVP
jgi:transcriptional regulator of aromatic amino acid metabolism